MFKHYFTLPAVVAALLFALLVPGAVTADDGDVVAAGFTGPLPRSGVELTTWGGGSVDTIAVDHLNVGSVWVSVGGELVGYVVGAPLFANGEFLTLYPSGELAAGTAVLVVVLETPTSTLPALAPLPGSSYTGCGEAWVEVSQLTPRPALEPGEAGDAVDSTGLAGIELEYSIPADWLLNSEYLLFSASWVSDNKSVAFAEVKVGEAGDGRITLWATWRSNLAETAEYVELKVRPESGGTVLTMQLWGGGTSGSCLNNN